MDRLAIYFRQHQLKDADNSDINVVVDCGSIASYVPGDVQLSDWINMTNFTEGLENFQTSWDWVNNASSHSEATNAGGSNYGKGLTADLTLFDDAFYYIWNFLLENECQILNSIDVRIDDLMCNNSYRIFEIKADNLDYEPDFPCKINVKLREQDLAWGCIYKTFIWDNHQNWFNETGTSAKDHPTFLTCIEPRPRIMNSVRIALMFLIQANPVMRFVDFITRGNIKDDVRRILELDNFLPAPLIRDYIDNVAAKCGLGTDTIFHRNGTPEYNACIFHALSGQMYSNDGDNELSPSASFIFENRWNITLPELLDYLKVLYNAEWFITPNNTIVFKPVLELIDLAPIYDFTAGDIEIRNVHYTFDGTKKPAFGRYEYQPDGSDLGSQEISNLYNDIVDYDGPYSNKMLEGSVTKSFEFASTSFVRDGRTKDYIKLLINDGKEGALVLLALLALLMVYALSMSPVGFGLGGTVFLIIVGVYTGWALTIAAIVSNMRSHFTSDSGAYTGAVRLVTANQTMTPRVLIWDGRNRHRAKVVRSSNPDHSPYYNSAAIPYATRNPISIDNPGGNIFNYPMYFDSEYKHNMFDRFHDAIDNPLKSLETHQSFTIDTDLCCAILSLLGVWENDFVKIGYIIIIERRPNYVVYGRIKSIDISYQDNTVRIKGRVIKKP